MFSKSKYRAKRVTHAGRSFASKLEHALYTLLLLREKAGEITELQCQDHIRIEILPGWVITCIPDFKFVCAGKTTWAEAKGFETDRWKMLVYPAWKHKGPGPLEIYKGSHRNLTLIETLLPLLIASCVKKHSNPIANTTKCAKVAAGKQTFGALTNSKTQEIAPAPSGRKMHLLHQYRNTVAGYKVCPDCGKVKFRHPNTPGENAFLAVAILLVVIAILAYRNT